MESATSPTPERAEALLAGAILEEYRDLLDRPQTRQAREERDTPDCEHTRGCEHETPACLHTPHDKEHSRACPDHPDKYPEKKKAMSWNDLPRA